MQLISISSYSCAQVRLRTPKFRFNVWINMWLSQNPSGESERRSSRRKRNWPNSRIVESLTSYVITKSKTVCCRRRASSRERISAMSSWMTPSCWRFLLCPGHPRPWTCMRGQAFPRWLHHLCRPQYYHRHISISSGPLLQSQSDRKPCHRSSNSRNWILVQITMESFSSTRKKNSTTKVQYRKTLSLMKTRKWTRKSASRCQRKKTVSSTCRCLITMWRYFDFLISSAWTMEQNMEFSSATRAFFFQAYSPDPSIQANSPTLTKSGSSSIGLPEIQKRVGLDIGSTFSRFSTTDPSFSSPAQIQGIALH